MPSAPGLETPGSAISPADVFEAMTWPGIIGLGVEITETGGDGGGRKLRHQSAQSIRRVSVMVPLERQKSVFVNSSMLLACAAAETCPFPPQELA